MGGYNLGNFAQQLSPEMTDDELMRAYQAAGGAPEDIAPAQSPAPATQPQSTPVLTRPPGPPARAIAAIDQATLDTQNERMALADSAGASAAQAQLDTAALHGQRAERARADATDARARGDKSRADADYYNAEARRNYEEMKEHSNPPGPKAIERVMGIVGGVLAMGGNGGAAYGAQLVGQLLGSGVDRQRWELEQEHRTRLFQAATRGVDMSNSSETHAYDTASRMIGADAHYYEAAADQIAAMARTEAERNAALKLKLDIKETALGKMRAIEVEKQKAAAAAAKTRKESYFWRVPLDQLRAMPSEILGKEGQEVLAQRVKNDQTDRKGEVEIEGSKLGNALAGAKLDAKTEEAGDQEVLPGLYATIPLERKDIVDIRANAQVISKIKSNYAELKAIREKHRGVPFSAWTDRDDYKRAQNIMSEMTGQLNQFSGRGAPSNVELKDVQANLMDPTSHYFLSEPSNVYDAQIERLERSQRSALEAIGVVPKGRPVASAGAPPPARNASAPSAPAASGGVRMVRPSDGKVFMLDPSRPGAMDLARQHGLVPADAGGPMEQGDAVAYAPRRSAAERILGGQR